MSPIYVVVTNPLAANKQPAALRRRLAEVAAPERTDGALPKKLLPIKDDAQPEGDTLHTHKKPLWVWRSE